MSLPGLFVVGTDTGVGKTHVAAALVRLLGMQSKRVGVLKPVATGATREGDTWRSEDAGRLIEATNRHVMLDRVVPILYEEPLAPSVAARRLGIPLEWDVFARTVREALDWWSGKADLMVVEGVGGLLCPLTEGTTVLDLACWLDYPLVIVARRGLGTLNHTLLTAEVARRKSLRMVGIVLNAAEPGPLGLAEATNAEELSRRLPDVPVLAELPHGDEATSREILSVIDWFPRARRSRFGGQA